jgi:uncharacterized membrane protein YdbT with pleckstrin-like domain
VAYPRKFLSPGEEIVTEFKPHWTSILGPIGITLTALALMIILLIFASGTVRQWGPLVVAVLWLVFSAKGFIGWLTTEHVITNERVIHRQGFISKHGKEIPLEMINTVAFRQTVFERIVGSGDVVIESAGEQGQTLYKDIPRPEQTQTLIYKVREPRMLQLEGGAQGATKAEQLQILSKLHDDGKLTDAEFDTQKSKILGSD